MEHYERVIPGFGKALLDAYTSQIEHRQSIERQAIQGDNLRATRGQGFAFIIALVALGGGIFCLVTGRSIEGYSLAIGSIGALVGAFWHGINKRAEERAAKRAEQPPPM